MATKNFNSLEPEKQLETNAGLLDNNPYASSLEGFSDEEIATLTNELEASLGLLIAANAEVIVRCDRLGGMEMTLSQAVLTIWPPSIKGAMMIEGLPSVMAEVQRMLANRVLDTEEAAEEEDELEQNVEQEEPTTRKSTGKEIFKKIDEKADKTLEEIDNKNQNQEAQNRLETARARIVEAIQGEPKQAPKNADKAQTINESSHKPTTARLENVASTAEKLIVPADKMQTAETEPTFRPVAEPIKPEPVDFDPEITSVVELAEGPVIAILQTELTEISRPEIESPEVFEDDLALAALEDQIIEDGESKFNPQLEEKYSTFYIEEDLAVIDEAVIPLTEDELFITDSAEIAGPEQFAQTSIVIEQVESILIALEEQLETSDLDTTEAVNETIDKIIGISAQLEVNGENVISETEAQEQLEELFTELLTLAGIKPTPETVVSLASLTIRWNLIDEIRQLKTEQLAEALKHSATHEFIKKLLVGISKIKKAITHAYKIGNSALLLCRFSFIA